MLQKLIEFAIHRRWMVLSAAGLLAIIGTIAFVQLPFDAFPDTTPVMVQVNVSAPGWSSEQIEQQITFPIERELSGLKNLTEVRSISKNGISQVNLVFSDDSDIYLSRQQTSERLMTVELPDGVEAPRLGPVSTGLGEIFQYIVISKNGDAMEARTVQDWVIRPQLQTVSGVAEINSWGGFEKQYQVLVDPNRLVQYGLGLPEVVEAIYGGIRNVAGGYLVRGGEQTMVQGIGAIENTEQIEQLIIESRNSTPILVRDIADVVIGHEIRLGAASYQGTGEAVLGLGFMITGGNSHEIADGLARQLAEVQKTLPEGIEVRTLYARTTLVDQVLHTVKDNLLLGAALVIAILFIFLGNLRAGLIVASAIPLSMLFAFDMMSRVGIIGSLMSLGAIDFGLAVDNAVIQVENAVRRLSESSPERSRFEVIRDAIMEVRKPTLYGELIIILVYLPILTLQGVEGKMFRPMALTVVFVLVGSLILSFTVIPALIATFLKKPSRERELKVMTWLKDLYRPAIEFALKRRAIVLGATGAVLVAGFLLFMSLGAEFIPRLNEGTIAINIVRLAGIDLNQTMDNNTRIEQILLEKFPNEIDHIWTRIGTAELATDPMGLELSDIFITLKASDQWQRGHSQDELVELIDAELADLPGMKRIFTQPIEMRVNEMSAGIRGDIGVKIFGDDLKTLEAKAEEIAALLETIEGSEDVAVEQLTGQPQFRMAIDRRRLARYDLPPADVLMMVESMGGIRVGEVYEGQRRFDLSVKMEPDYAVVPEDIERIPIKAGQALVSLEDVVSPAIESGYSTITREWGRRRAVVQCNVRDRDVGSFVNELRDRIDKDIKFDPGYFVRFGGQFENLERARTRLAIAVPIALLLIFALLYATYSSTRDALLIFTGVPLAAVGGVVALYLRGMPFSISAGVGFIALSGVAVLNGLVLVSSIKALRSNGVPLIDSIKQSGESRLRPVLMTALVAAFGFIPMAISTGVGAEVQRPLATVVVGGILTSTLLTLFVLPLLYSVFGGKSRVEA